MTNISGNILVLAAAVHLSCVGNSQFPLRVHDWSERELLQNANLVVLATTSKAEWQQRRIPVKSDLRPGINTARLVELRLKVEQVIRGTLESNELVVHYWAADDFTNAGSLNLPAVGERAIHFLNANQGMFRYVTDLVRGKIPVFSGSHAGSLAGTGDQEQAKISSILLTPGEGMQADLFARNLGTSVARSLQLQGFVQTLPLVRNLLKSKDQEISWAACTTLYEDAFIGQDDCLTALNSNTLARTHERELHALLTSRKDSTIRFATAFLADPVKTAKGYSLLPGKEGVEDFLRLIAQHPDRSLASRAEIELEKLGKRTALARK